MLQRYGIPLLITGAAVGWLMGLSVSPVVSSVLSAVLAVITALVAAAAGLKLKDSEGNGRVEAWPVALLLIGIAVTVPAAIYVREAQLLVPKAARTALQDTSTRTTTRVKGALYAGPAPSTCDRVSGKEGEDLANAFITAPDELFQKIGSAIRDPAILSALRATLCPGS